MGEYKMKNFSISMFTIFGILTTLQVSADGNADSIVVYEKNCKFSIDKLRGQEANLPDKKISNYLSREEYTREFSELEHSLLYDRKKILTATLLQLNSATDAKSKDDFQSGLGQQLMANAAFCRLATETLFKKIEDTKKSIMASLALKVASVKGAVKGAFGK